MADIVNSRELDQAEAMVEFKKIVALVNENWEKDILSPLTITLGDEFQGLIKELRSALTIIFALEEGLIMLNAKFKLRYVLYEGTIDTPINLKVAYGMMGDGLTHAREALDASKHSDRRFNVTLKEFKQSQVLNNTLFLYQKLVDNWNHKDYNLIVNFVLFEDYKKVAKELGKDRSLMWKRRRSLRIDEYLSIKEIASYLVSNVKEP